MRARIWLTGAVLGAALLTSGAAAAQAAPAPSDTSVTVVTEYWKKMKMGSLRQCEAMRDSYAGSAFCAQEGSTWYLWILVP
ncbi:hypothetical protein SAMN02787144_101111 [Streptomyces atratus]|uniref:Uncharacterized protein n=1 Tax=Streptomyces atratus TaxID=1893 RepID=A0A1K2CIJ1_STRAR|nr:hypothetical protein SAMN02787144_101111 [Streptomyces atratus]